ncbi:MAG: ATP-binding protein [Bradyrhizobium sp.]|uniref:ATP-binding protein n=1 Tax=Bradyrhizobium sp. TaxID=376 RepID=UPI003C7971D7
MADNIDDLEDLFDSAPCGYLAAGADGRITKVNSTYCKWLDREKSTFIGHRFQDSLNIAGKIYYETHFAPLMRMQGFFNEVALDLVRADGSTLPVLVNAAERRDESNHLRFIRITVFNASDRRRYERELLESRRAAERANAELLELNQTLERRVAEAVEARLKSERALHQAQKMEAVGQLTGGIAHDFNNMLSVIVSSLGLLERRLVKGEDVSRFVFAAKEGANRAADLTRRLLSFSRQQTLAPEAINANQMVADMSELLRRTLGEAVQFETVLAGGLWHVHADRNLLESAILNLAINARDAMPDGGRLTIETANCHLDEAYAAEQAIASGQYVMVAVTDTGTGMTPDVVAKAFEPFFTTKGVGKGTGLGLSQVFGFVKQSNGHIKIYSEIDHGTTMKIYLPRFYGASEGSKPQTKELLALASGREVILLVEDDAQVLSLTAQTLGDLGYEVIETRNAAEALEALSAHPEICLLYTDLVMPEMNGRALADEARRRRPDLKILFTTGYARNAIVHNGILDPDMNLLQKPASMQHLAGKVREVLNSKS